MILFGVCFLLYKHAYWHRLESLKYIVLHVFNLGTVTVFPMDYRIVLGLSILNIEFPGITNSSLVDLKFFNLRDFSCFVVEIVLVVL